MAERPFNWYNDQKRFFPDIMLIVCTTRVTNYNEGSFRINNSYFEATVCKENAFLRNDEGKHYVVCLNITDHH